MKKFVFILFLGLSLLFGPSTSTFTLSEESPLYDHSASTECKAVPEDALYNGGIIEKQAFEIPVNSKINAYTTALTLNNIQADTIYAFSGWFKITGADSALIRATIDYDNRIDDPCVGNVVAKKGCWSFLKGGFFLESPLNTKRVVINFRDDYNQTINVLVSGASLQPFTLQQWEQNRQHVINTERKRTTTLHVLDTDGNRLQGAKVVVNQVAKDFPFGTVVSKEILENKKYQDWFLERFNTAVFENELKWNRTEPDQQGKINYTLPDQMLKFLRSKQITVRGHNVVWEQDKHVPQWVQNLNNTELIKAATYSRFNDVMTRYKDEFVHWDVNNEILPYDFFKKWLGPNSSIEFYRAAEKLDPRTRMFMNEFSTLENCDDQCAVDKYVEKLRELMNNGVSNLGIGLQSHFGKPNPAFIRGGLDKLATLNLPIWLTEVDISNKTVPDKNLKAKYMEVALREGFSHPSVNGIMMWTAWGPKEGDCYRLCLQDKTFAYNPAGYTVDKLLQEWETKEVKGETNDQGIFNFSGFLGEYKVSVTHGTKSRDTTLYLPHSHDTKHWNIYL